MKKTYDILCVVAVCWFVVSAVLDAVDFSKYWRIIYYSEVVCKTKANTVNEVFDRLLNCPINRG